MIKLLDPFQSKIQLHTDENFVQRLWDKYVPVSSASYERISLIYLNGAARPDGEAKQQVQMTIDMVFKNLFILNNTKQNQILISRQAIEKSLGFSMKHYLEQLKRTDFQAFQPLNQYITCLKQEEEENLRYQGWRQESHIIKQLEQEYRIFQDFSHRVNEAISGQSSGIRQNICQELFRSLKQKEYRLLTESFIWQEKEQLKNYLRFSSDKQYQKILRRLSEVRKLHNILTAEVKKIREAKNTTGADTVSETDRTSEPASREQLIRSLDVLNQKNLRKFYQKIVFFDREPEKNEMQPSCTGIIWKQEKRDMIRQLKQLSAEKLCYFQKQLSILTAEACRMEEIRLEKSRTEAQRKNRQIRYQLYHNFFVNLEEAQEKYSSEIRKSLKTQVLDTMNQEEYSIISKSVELSDFLHHIEQIPEKLLLESEKQKNRITERKAEILESYQDILQTDSSAVSRKAEIVRSQDGTMTDHTISERLAEWGEALLIHSEYGKKQDDSSGGKFLPEDGKSDSHGKILPESKESDSRRKILPESREYDSRGKIPLENKEASDHEKQTEIIRGHNKITTDYIEPEKSADWSQATLIHPEYGKKQDNNSGGKFLPEDEKSGSNGKAFPESKESDSRRKILPESREFDSRGKIPLENKEASDHEKQTEIIRSQNKITTDYIEPEKSADWSRAILIHPEYGKMQDNNSSAKFLPEDGKSGSNGKAFPESKESDSRGKTFPESEESDSHGKILPESRESDSRGKIPLENKEASDHGNQTEIIRSQNKITTDYIEPEKLAEWSQAILIHPEYGKKQNNNSSGKLFPEDEKSEGVGRRFSKIEEAAYSGKIPPENEASERSGKIPPENEAFDHEKQAEIIRIQIQAAKDRAELQRLAEQIGHRIQDESFQFEFQESQFQNPSVRQLVRHIRKLDEKQYPVFVRALSDRIILQRQRMQDAAADKKEEQKDFSRPQSRTAEGGTELQRLAKQIGHYIKDESFHLKFQESPPDSPPIRQLIRHIRKLDEKQYPVFVRELSDTIVLQQQRIRDISTEKKESRTEFIQRQMRTAKDLTESRQSAGQDGPLIENEKETPHLRFQTKDPKDGREIQKFYAELANQIRNREEKRQQRYETRIHQLEARYSVPDAILLNTQAAPEKGTSEGIAVRQDYQHALPYPEHQSSLRHQDHRDYQSYINNRNLRYTVMEETLQNMQMKTDIRLQEESVRMKSVQEQLNTRLNEMEKQLSRAENRSGSYVEEDVRAVAERVKKQLHEELHMERLRRGML